MSSKPSLKLIGELVVVALKGRNLPNREVIGKQDPFCVFRIGDQTKKTKTDYRGGQHPIWDDQVNIPVAEGKAIMAVQVFDEDPKKEDLIGECDIDLKQVFQDGEADEWYKLTYKGRPAGEVYLELTFYSNAAPPRPSAPQTVRQPQNQLNGPPGNRPPQSPQPHIPGGYPVGGISPPPHFNGPNIYPPQQLAPIQGGYSPVQQSYPPVQQGYPPLQQVYPPLQQGYPPRPNPPPPQPQQGRPTSQQSALQTPRPPPQVSTYQPALATTPLPPSQGFYPSNIPPRAISPPQSQPAPLLSSAYTPAPSSSPAINSQTAPGFSYPGPYAPSPVGGFVLPPHADSQPYGYQPNQTAPFVPPHTSPATNPVVDPYAGQYPPPVPIAPGIGQPSLYNPSQSSGEHNLPPHYI